jgi:hypothetical protein
MSTDASEVRAASIALIMEAARTSETSVDNYFTRKYIPEDKSELHTRRRENLKSQQIHCLHPRQIKGYKTRENFIMRVPQFVSATHQVY